MPEALRGFLDQFNQGGLGQGLEGLARRGPAAAPGPMPEGARFVAGSFGAKAGSRAYKLYIPSTRRSGPVPLVVMLHGCTQSPDDFAAGTRMNLLAEEHGVLILYPAQPSSANAQKCWNWFSPGDQQRDQGEPSLIAGMTRQVMREHAADPRRVYVAGLSAGGAAAAIMGQSYPDLYAAVGVHSGTACGAARDLTSALAAMRQGAAGTPLRTGDAARVIPTIVFHADRDTTVHPRNGDQVIAQSAAAAPSGLRTETQRGQVADGHAYSRTLHADAAGQTVLEQWLIHGGGHAGPAAAPPAPTPTRVDPMPRARCSASSWSMRRTPPRDSRAGRPRGWPAPPRSGTASRPCPAGSRAASHCPASRPLRPHRHVGHPPRGRHVLRTASPDLSHRCHAADRWRRFMNVVCPTAFQVRRTLHLFICF
ncbi:extracellular catalytic domain type 1 short-chain-length polyhydroxyalkanoate depolymerase [Teichococcus aestuarii]|uniref:extracellular catalytic domain type 1 short-chain-length polyhydroxyalkanoate depolymerase n=1 Tax=Teichococcus aestuarii TaxID=568898 RepID=UPI003617BE81